MYQKDETLRMSFSDVRTMKRAVQLMTAMAKGEKVTNDK
jgi:hypothetical protein